MKKIARSLVLSMLFLWMLPFHASAVKTLVPVGQVIGLELQDGTVTVAGFEESQSQLLQKSGLAVGDRIVEINGKPVYSAGDIRSALGNACGQVKLTFQREGKSRTITLTSRESPDGPKLGIYLRQGVTGVGTVTWYDPQTGQFGCLGHGVNDGGGELVQLQKGSAYRAGIVSVKKGRSGEPGQLMGAVASRDPLGQLTANTGRGVFGNTEIPWEGNSLPVASTAEITTGAATILSTVDDTGVHEYSVEILKIYPRSKENGRNLLLKVTDPKLLETTGGIVQGMSGSPILQDGRIVGAVTHVLVNDPTTGYGIFIENMLEAAS